MQQLTDKGKGKKSKLAKCSKPFSNGLKRDNILTGCNCKTRSLMCSLWGEAMFPCATPVGWLSEQFTALISLPTLGMEQQSLHPQSCYTIIVYLHKSSCLFSVLQLPFMTFSKLPACSLASPCYSDEKTRLKLSNLESEIRAGGGYYLWVDSDWIGSRGSSTPKWQLGGNPGPIYLIRRSHKQLWLGIGGHDDEMHHSRASGEKG